MGHQDLPRWRYEVHSVPQVPHPATAEDIVSADTYLHDYLHDYLSICQVHLAYHEFKLELKNN